MKLSLGIVGLPNVGKSSLFNLLTRNMVEAKNYPFCTIDPNIGVVEVKDKRLDKISDLVNPEKKIYPVIEFYDIAGLVKGAHEGQGLGNQFLSHIRNTNAVVHVIRDFVDTNILHVENRIDALSDKEIVEAELILKDIETIEKALSKVKHEGRGNKQEQKVSMLENIKLHLEKGKIAFSFANEEDKDLIDLRKSLFLLTDKPFLYLVNTDLTNYNDEYIKKMKNLLGLNDNDVLIPIDVKMELDLAALDEEERNIFYSDYGIKMSPLDTLIMNCYKKLGLQTFFTAGPKEVRGWTIEVGDTAPEAAGAIHTDFMDKFITAEVVSYDDFMESGDWQKAKDLGKVRLEGKTYIMKDGDIVIFKHGA